MQLQAQYSPQWNDVCSQSDLVLDSGVCALVEEMQIAIFAVKQQGEVRLFAISNWDPIGKANVLYRGIVGSIGDEPVVASPLYKQHFSLACGRCFEQDDVSVNTYDVRVVHDRIQIAI